MSFRLLANLLLTLLWLILLPAVALAQGPVGFGAVGDSLTDEYSTKPNYSTARNWLEQMAVHRASSVTFGSAGPTYPYNRAVAGATTTSLLANGQHTVLAANITAGQVQYAVVGIASNDYGNVWANIYNGVLAGAALETFRDQALARTLTAVDTLRAAGSVRLIVMTPGDYTVTPGFQSPSFADPARRALVTAAVTDFSNLLTASALARGIPVFRLDQLCALISDPAPLVVGGVTLDKVNFQNGVSNPTHVFEDSVHPGSVVQGLMANALMLAANQSYGSTFDPFTEQEILTNAGITPPLTGPTYFNVDPYIVAVPEPGVLAFLGLAFGGCTYARYRRRQYLELVVPSEPVEVTDG